jgi:CHAD domain-containing protein
MLILDDHEDIQALCHGCFLKLAQLYPESFISILDNLIDNFKDKLAKLREATKESKVEVKKLHDLNINIKRLFDELKKVPEVEENPKFIDLNNEVVNSLAAAI